MTRIIVQLVALVALAVCSEWWPSRLGFTLLACGQAAVLLRYLEAS